MTNFLYWLTHIVSVPNWLMLIILFGTISSFAMIFKVMYELEHERKAE